jgi:TolB-like protein/DNA-binding SARP family transcriptional activator
MIELQTLGGLSLTDSQGRELRPLLAQPKRLALLAYLAVHNHHGPRRRDSVVALFWPELDAEHARGALRQALRFLRRTLGDGVLNSRSDEALDFEGAALWCDAVAFEQACEAGRLLEAFELYRGDFLDGLFVSGTAPELEQWVENERTRLRELAARAARSLSERFENEGDLPQGVRWGRRALDLLPDEEETLRRLIALLDRLGDRAAAVHVYERFARRLATEHEIEPSVETQALIEAVRTRAGPASPERVVHSSPSGAPVNSGTISGPDAGIAVGGRAPRRRRLGPVLLAALGAVALGTWFTTSRAHRPIADPPATSVAVLYFENLSRDTLDEYLVDGLTEEIVSRLGGIDRLRVKSRNAVRRLRSDTSDDPAALGRSLGVRFLVEGSVRRAGERVRVTVRLVNSADGFRVWGADFDRETADLLGVEEDIAANVAANVAGQLLPVERAALGRRLTRNLGAYDQYLRGNYHLAQRTQRSVSLAIREYDAAARLDSGFTMALARSAYGHALFLSWGWTHPRASPSELLAEGLVTANRALAQDSTSSDAWMARAYLLTVQRPRTYEGAADAFQRALALDSANAEASHQYGWVLAQLGRDSAAIAANLRALEIDPERAVTLGQLGEISMARHRLEDAARWLDSALAVDPAAAYARGDRTFVRMWLGDTTGARDDAMRLDEQALLAMLDMRAGDSAQARSRMRAALRDVGTSGQLTVAAAWDVSMGLVAVGESNWAFDLLDRVRPRGPSLWFLLRMPGFDPVGTHPRYRRLVEESRPPARTLSLR